MFVDDPHKFHRWNIDVAYAAFAVKTGSPQVELMYFHAKTVTRASNVFVDSPAVTSALSALIFLFFKPELYLHCSTEYIAASRHVVSKMVLKAILENPPVTSRASMKFLHAACN